MILFAVAVLSQSLVLQKKNKNAAVDVAAKLQSCYGLRDYKNIDVVRSCDQDRFSKTLNIMQGK